VSESATDVRPYPVSEQIFLCLAGVFLASMVCMNILGITKFIQIPGAGWNLPFKVFGQQLTFFQLALGVLPYPLTFLATDLVCELYGKKRASHLVWVGFGLNMFLLTVCGLGFWLSAAPFDAHRAWYDETWKLMGGLGKPASYPPPGHYYAQIWGLMAGATVASMVAYLIAQLIDVHLFHFWRRLTQGKHLWLRNNGSTMISQMVDTVCVLGLTFWGKLDEPGKGLGWLAALILCTYAFKLIIAALDTPFFYLGVYLLKPYIPPDADGLEEDQKYGIVT